MLDDSDRVVLRTIIREEVRAAMDEHEANLAVARVRRSAALEELARLDAQAFCVGLDQDGYPAVRRVSEIAASAVGRNRGWMV